MQVLRRPLMGLGRLGVMALVVVAVFAGGLGIGSGLSSTGAQSNNEIRGCVNRFTGALRIINGNQQCSTGELPLNWDQRAGMDVDVQVVKEEKEVTTDDRTNIVGLSAECPAGYIATGGGGGVGTSSGSDIWAVTRGEALELEDGTPHGWNITLRTTSGENAEGQYLMLLETV